MKVLMIGPSNLGPYHFARFRSLVKLLPDITYVRIGQNEDYRPWSSDLGAAPCNIINVETKESISNLLDKEKPDIVIAIGYTSWAVLRSAYWAKTRGLPSVLQFDSTLNDHPRYWLKELVKKIIVRRLFDGAFVAGSRSSLYVQKLGITAKYIWSGVDVVDNAHFESAGQKLEYPRNFPEKHFITVARLSGEKNISRLLQAFELYRSNGGDWGLVIVGTGPVKNELKQSVPESLTVFVYWHGWASYRELPSLYGGASCFILPSISEPWGLVVNEAMAAGLPVLISNNCGCVPELCQSGLNGYSFDPVNEKDLAELMFLMSSNTIDLRAMGNASRKIINDYTPGIWSKTLQDMAVSMLIGNKKSAGDNQTDI